MSSSKQNCHSTMSPPTLHPPLLLTYILLPPPPPPLPSPTSYTYPTLTQPHPTPPTTLPPHSSSLLPLSHPPPTLKHTTLPPHSYPSSPHTLTPTLKHTTLPPHSSPSPAHTLTPHPQAYNPPSSLLPLSRSHTPPPIPTPPHTLHPPPPPPLTLLWGRQVWQHKEKLLLLLLLALCRADVSTPSEGTKERPLFSPRAESWGARRKIMQLSESAESANTHVATRQSVVSMHTRLLLHTCTISNRVGIWRSHCMYWAEVSTLENTMCTSYSHTHNKRKVTPNWSIMHSSASEGNYKAVD